MLKVNLIDSATNKILESFLTSFGRILGVSTYQKEKSVWNNVNWAAAVAETALASPIGDGSVELCDIVVTGEKKAGGSITLHFDDGTNEKNVLRISVDDSAAYLAVDLTGKVQGWQGAPLYYTVVGTFTGSLLITFVRHNKEQSKTYDQMVADNGW